MTIRKYYDIMILQGNTLKHKDKGGTNYEGKRRTTLNCL